jgi:hypothetical protein
LAVPNALCDRPIMNSRAIDDAIGSFPFPARRSGDLVDGPYAEDFHAVGGPAQRADRIDRGDADRIVRPYPAVDEFDSVAGEVRLQEPRLTEPPRASELLSADGTRRPPFLPLPRLPFSLVLRAEPGNENILLKIASAHEAPRSRGPILGSADETAARRRVRQQKSWSFPVMFSGGCSSPFEHHLIG